VTGCVTYRVELSSASRAVRLAVVRLRVNPGGLWRTPRLLQRLGWVGRSL